MSIQDEIAEIVAGAVADERERCAKLCEMLADIMDHSAARIRAKGTRWSWFKPAPGYERCAKDIDAAAAGHRTVAYCIRMGYDPKASIEHEVEKINLMQQEMTAV